MSKSTDILEQVPDWLIRPLPFNASINDKLCSEIDKLCKKLPDNMYQLERRLNSLEANRDFDAAQNHACAGVWQKLENFFSSDVSTVKTSLIRFAEQHFVEQAKARVFRRLIKDIDPRIRARAKKALEDCDIREVALPQKKDGTWDQTGWFQGTEGAKVSKKRHGQRVQKLYGLPVLKTVGAIRELLDIRSEGQLGWMLLATHTDEGPYTRFTIDKRDKSERPICAPKDQLLWVQRRLLRAILDKIPAHPAAHGFVQGRSTVTNAEPHLGAKLLLKFDLTDFFPTIHYYRVVGFFTSLGYGMEDARFAASDDSTQVAPTLARLCCHADDPWKFGSGALPQGAPTSPAISNLICRRLDARLSGLAQRNEGCYTRYADDLTFSFPEDKISVGRFRWWVDQVCHQEGFFVKQAKFRVIRSSQRQTVTGIVVNDELRVPRPERRRFRAILHNIKHKGIESQAKLMAKKVKNKKPGTFREYLRGFASYVHMVHPEEGAELLRQVNELLAAEES